MFLCLKEGPATYPLTSPLPWIFSSVERGEDFSTSPLFGCKTSRRDTGPRQASHPQTQAHQQARRGSQDAVLTPLSYRGRATAVAGENPRSPFSPSPLKVVQRDKEGSSCLE